jgi:hypothetical protein
MDLAKSRLDSFSGFCGFLLINERCGGPGRPATGAQFFTTGGGELEDWPYTPDPCFFFGGSQEEGGLQILNPKLFIRTLSIGHIQTRLRDELPIGIERERQ